jgi:hypothetical protein
MDLARNALAFALLDAFRMGCKAPQVVVGFFQFRFAGAQFPGHFLGYLDGAPARGTERLKQCVQQGRAGHSGHHCYPGQNAVELGIQAALGHAEIEVPSAPADAERQQRTKLGLFVGSRTRAVIEQYCAHDSA